VKIKKLDGELGRYKEQMSKLRNGPGKVRYTRIILIHGTDTTIIYGENYLSFIIVVTTESDPRARTSCVEAEEDVRESTGTVNATDIQHGVCGACYREFKEYNGNSRRYEASKQRFKATIRQN
jgi:hypothetical protein